MEKRPDHTPQHRHRRRSEHRGGHDPGHFFGLDISQMSPKAQVTAALAVLIPVMLAGAAVLAVFPYIWWLIFVFGWTIFPAFGLLVRAIAGLSDGGDEVPAANGKERELLEALRESGELPPARAAIETSLTVAEADGVLRRLAEGGHLEVRVRGGGLFCALWEPTPAPMRGPEG